MPRGVYERTPETRASISAALKKGYETGTRTAPWIGKKFSDEHVENMRLSRLGKHTGADNGNWKGDQAGYAALHKWIARQLGKASKCENCDDPIAKKYEWANLSGEYKRDITDWAEMCATCHYRYDDIHRRAWITRRSKLNKESK